MLMLMLMLVRGAMRVQVLARIDSHVAVHFAFFPILRASANTHASKQQRASSSKSNSSHFRLSAVKVDRSLTVANRFVKNLART
jgi:hypothetical protein